MFFPWQKIEKQEVMGVLKASGSRDKDVIQLHYKGILQFPKVAKIVGTVCIVVGILACIPIVTAIFGIPMAIFGWWIRRRAVGNIQTVESTYTEYVAAL